MTKMSRLSFLIGIPLVLAGCALTEPEGEESSAATPQQGKMYDVVITEKYVIPAVNLAEVNPRYYRQAVNYPTRYAPGTIVIDTSQRFLYLVQNDGKAIRYGVGVGRDGFRWSGSGVIGRKAVWPSWTPPGSMIRRDPSLAKYAGGMPPGLGNPLGARALYLYSGRRDMMYRVHGTNEPWSIGHAISSGCIRMINQDAIDLYNRVGVGTRVIVLQGQMPQSFLDTKTRTYVMAQDLP